MSLPPEERRRPSTVHLRGGDSKHWEHVYVNDNWILCINEEGQITHIPRDIVKKVVRHD